MSGIKRPHNDALRDALASQYVLGTLQGRARRNFERRLDRDPELRLRVQEWSHRLSPLASALAPIEPPAAVWRRIESQIRPRRRGDSLRLGLWENLNFWRGLSATTAALVVAIISWVAVPTQTVAQKPNYLVVVNDQQAQPAWVIETSIKGKMVMVKTLREMPMAPNMTCALWLTWDDGMTMSLGKLPEKPGMMAMEKPPMPGRRLDNARVVVSVEPMESFDEKSIKGQRIFTDKWMPI